MSASNFKAAKPSSPKASGSSYWIVPPGGTKKVRYKRVSGFIAVLEDKGLLANRDVRFAAHGVASDANLAKSIASMNVEEDKFAIDKLAERAARKAGKWFKADYGTVLHAVTEDHDAGYEVLTKAVPESPSIAELKWGTRDVLLENWDSIRRDAEAYARLIDAYQITFDKIEATVVLDDYEVAGTLDRIMTVGKAWSLPDDGEPKVGDVKSGSLDYGQLEKPTQFACYQMGVLYNHDTHERTPHSATSNTALVIHVPAGEGRATLVPLDLSQAKERLELCHQVIKARKSDDINDWTKYGAEEWLSTEIASASDDAALTALYERTQNMWTEDHVQQAREKF